MCFYDFKFLPVFLDFGQKWTALVDVVVVVFVVVVVNAFL